MEKKRFDFISKQVEESFKEEGYVDVFPFNEHTKDLLCLYDDEVDEFLELHKGEMLFKHFDDEGEVVSIHAERHIVEQYKFEMELLLSDLDDKPTADMAECIGLQSFEDWLEYNNFEEAVKED